MTSTVVRTVALVLFSCCASFAEANDVKLTIVSLPEGATVFTIQPDGTEKMWGTGPVTLKWQLPRKWIECVTTEAVKVRWISGVEATVNGVQMCPRTGKNQQFVFQRPNLPGVEVDVQYAVALMQSAATAAAAAEQARASRRAAILAAIPPRQKVCTSNIVGNQVFTYCY